MVLPEGVTQTLFVAPSKVLRLRLLAPEADIDVDAHLCWVLACGALVLAMDRKLVPPLAPLRGGGMTASGAIMTTHASSLTKVFSGVGLMGCGISSKLKVGLEPVYKASAWLVIAQRGVFRIKANHRGKEMLGVESEEA